MLRLTFSLEVTYKNSFLPLVSDTRTSLFLPHHFLEFDFFFWSPWRLPALSIYLFRIHQSSIYVYVAKIVHKTKIKLKEKVCSKVWKESSSLFLFLVLHYNFMSFTLSWIKNYSSLTLKSFERGGALNWSKFFWGTSNTCKQGFWK